MNECAKIVIHSELSELPKGHLPSFMCEDLAGGWGEGVTSTVSFKKSLKMTSELKPGR